MKKSVFKDAKIIPKLQQYESGMKATDICGVKGISRATFFAGRVSMVADAQLKHMQADLSFDHLILKDIIENLPADREALKPYECKEFGQ